jgi:membrane-bound lytic murein transglycosylase B
MRATRRTFTLALAAGALAACAGGGAPGPLAARAPAPEPQFLPAPNPAFDAWLAGFRARAQSRGIAPATLDRALAGAGFLPGVIERDRNQTEFTRTLEDYLAIAASEERVTNGRAALRDYGPLLSEIDARFGVEPRVVVAIWGLESSYGTRRGTVPVISALATLAYDGRRGAFFEQQLTAALRILQNGDTTPEAMTGSWAGAMGHTQFIPTSFLAYAVDFRGDGRRDIWSDDPTDALASAAAYLSRSGWRRGQPWGGEVSLPQGFAGPTGRSATRTGAQWAAAGVREMDGRPVADHGPASILRPAGPSGPAFIVNRNFRGDPALQQRGELRARRRPPLGPGGGRRADPRPLPARRPRHDDRRPPGAAAAADRGGLRHARDRRRDRPQHPRRDQRLRGGRGPPRHRRALPRPARPPRRLGRGRPPGPLIG